MPARTRKIKLTEEWKEKIQLSMIINRLNSHIKGDLELSSTQIRAAEILLRKLIPDLARTEVKQETNINLTLSDARESIYRMLNATPLQSVAIEDNSNDDDN